MADPIISRLNPNDVAETRQTVYALAITMDQPALLEAVKHLSDYEELLRVLEALDDVMDIPVPWIPAERPNNESADNPNG